MIHRNIIITNYYILLIHSVPLFNINSVQVYSDYVDLTMATLGNALAILSSFLHIIKRR